MYGHVFYFLFAALRNSNGSFILNGGFVVSMFRKLIDVKGAQLEYSGSDTVVERINATKMVLEDIELLVSLLYKVFYPF